MVSRFEHQLVQEQLKTNCLLFRIVSCHVKFWWPKVAFCHTARAGLGGVRCTCSLFCNGSTFIAFRARGALSCVSEACFITWSSVSSSLAGTPYSNCTRAVIHCAL